LIYFRRFKLRNLNAANVIETAVLVGDNVGCSVNLQHHHCFVFGDLNYRITDDSQAILENLARVCQVEKETSGENWRKERWEKIIKQPTEGSARSMGLNATVDDLHLQGSRACEEAWSDFQTMDELSKAMSSQNVFYGFKEAPISFPPSFRRKRGEAGDCGDYSDLAVLNNAFTTTVASDEDFEGKDEAQKIEILKKNARPPSYTDRILLYSMDDREKAIQMGPYELCDNLTASDHRPIALACTLAIDPCYARAIKKTKRSSAAGVAVIKNESDAFEEPNIGSVVNDKEITVFVSISSPQLDLYTPKMAKESMDQLYTEYLTQELEAEEQLSFDEERQMPCDEGDSVAISVDSMSSDVKGVELVFPIPAEDPLAEQRKIAVLSDLGIIGGAKRDTAVMFRCDQGNEFYKNDVMKNVENIQWDEFQKNGVSMASQVSPQLGMHALIKFKNKENQVLGQGLICLQEIIVKHYEIKKKGAKDVIDEAIKIPLTVGGQYRGSLEVKIECYVLKKNE